MLIPDSICWILGTWAKEIQKWNSERYEFVIFPFGEIKENKKLFISVLQKVDIVHCLTPWGFSSVKEIIDIDQITHLTQISTIHHIVEFSQIESCLLADKIMVVNRKYLNELILKGVSKEKVFLIHNGVDTDFFSPKNKLKSKEKFRIPLEDYCIGFSAKASSDHDGRKGIDIFLGVLSTLSSNLKSDVHIIITGPGWNEYIKSLQLNNIQIHYFPFLPQKKMPDFYNSLDLYLVTSRVEGGPVPLLEAMSCGITVISTSVGIVPEFIKDDFNGLIIPTENIKSTVKAIEILYYNREFAKKLGSAGRDTILQNLQWKDTVSKIDRLYGTSINRKSYEDKINISKLNSTLIRKDIKRWEEEIGQQFRWYKTYKRIFRLLNKLRKYFQNRLFFKAKK
jgi:glycosyltransferase involved in cell wall biosynthesis